MAKCEFCGKDVKFGIKVSHSHRRSNRTCLHPLFAFRQGNPCQLRIKWAVQMNSPFFIS